VKLGWTAVAGATGYRVLQVAADGSTTVITSVGANATSATVGGFTAGSTVKFEVEAYNSAQKADSAPVSITLPTAPPSTTLAAPTLTVTATSPTRVSLSWNAVPGANGYRIYWWNGVRAVLLRTFGSSITSVRVMGLTPGSTNQFLVEAFGSGQIADSDWVSVTTPRRSTSRSGAASSWT
jgi:hypothetical protein